MPCRSLFELVLPGLRTCWQKIVAIRLLGFDGSFGYIVDDFMSKPSNVMRNKKKIIYNQNFSCSQVFCLIGMVNCQDLGIDKSLVVNCFGIPLHW